MYPCTTRWLDQVVYPGNNDNQFANTPIKPGTPLKKDKKKYLDIGNNLKT